MLTETKIDQRSATSLFRQTDELGMPPAFIAPHQGKAQNPPDRNSWWRFIGSAVAASLVNVTTVAMVSHSGLDRLILSIF